MLWEKTFGDVWTHLRTRNQCYVTFNSAVMMPSASPVLPEAQLLYYSRGDSPSWPRAGLAASHIRLLFLVTVGHYNNVH